MSIIAENFLLWNPCINLIQFIYIYINGAAVYQWCGFKSRRGKNKNLTALKSNSNIVWFNFQTYIPETTANTIRASTSLTGPALWGLGPIAVLCKTCRVCCCMYLNSINFFLEIMKGMWQKDLRLLNALKKCGELSKVEQNSLLYSYNAASLFSKSTK